MVVDEIYERTKYLTALKIQQTQRQKLLNENTTWVRGTIFNDKNYWMKIQLGLEELFSTTKTTG